MRALHLSGKWDTPDADVRRATLALIEAHKPLVVSHTEAGRHIDALADIPGYLLYGVGECALQVRADIRRPSREVALSPLPIPRRDGELCRALVVRVSSSALGPAHTRIVIHLPSGVEGADGFRRNEQRRVYADCIRGLRRLVASIDGPVVITGDWNIDLRQAWVRRYLRLMFPGFTHTPIPGRGTKGARVIDFSITRGYVHGTPATLLNAASDHRALLERMKETAVMAHTITRSEWGARAARGGPGPLSQSRVEGIALHWPAMKSPLRGIAAVSAALRNWQAHHMDTQGWSDIGYQEAYDQDGHRYILRGMLTQSGANGNEDVNERFGAYLLVLAPGEQPSAAMMTAVRAGIARHRAAFPNSRRIVGHGQIRPGGSQCPGPIVQGLINDGKFAPAPPLAPSKVTRVKAALLAILNGSDARGIPTQRRFVRGLLATIRATVNRLPER